VRAVLAGETDRSSGPRPALWDDAREHVWHRILEVELKSEYRRLFGDRKLLPPDTALKFLQTMWERYPLMRELYPEPTEIIGSSEPSQRSAAA
jgi:hypothetical protein